MPAADPFRDCRTTPLWWDDVPRPASDAAPLPPRIDLLVVGSGYTGLSAAIAAAKGGMSVLVADSGAIGEGCSTRNGGQVSTSIKPSLSALSGRHGAALAARIREEGRNALAHAESVAAAEGADCGWQRNGRFYAAHSARQFAAMERAAEAAHRNGDPAMTLVPRDRQREELASDLYFGGSVTEAYAAVHPAKLHRRLVERARALGVAVRGGTGVSAIAREADQFDVRTAAGTVRARRVLVATNGYSGPLSPWLRRRVIPVGSYILATEPLGRERMAEIIPRDRTVVDSRKVVIYFRSSPDQERIVFGGRAALFESEPLRALPRLYAMMLEILPQLAGTRVTHAWMGRVAYTFDTLPHIGVHDGVHYAMGYCGSGVSLALYFGMRAGQQVLGLPEGRTALDGLSFATRPLYGGTPWFLAPTVLTYRLIDRWFS